MSILGYSLAPIKGFVAWVKDLVMQKLRTKEDILKLSHQDEILRKDFETQSKGLESLRSDGKADREKTEKLKEQVGNLSFQVEMLSREAEAQRRDNKELQCQVRDLSDKLLRLSEREKRKRRELAEELRQQIREGFEQKLQRLQQSFEEKLRGVREDTVKDILSRLGRAQLEREKQQLLQENQQLRQALALPLGEDTK